MVQAHHRSEKKAFFQSTVTGLGGDFGACWFGPLGLGGGGRSLRVAFDYNEGCSTESTCTPN